MKRHICALLIFFILPGVALMPAAADAAVSGGGADFKIALVRNAQKVEVSNVDYKASAGYAKIFEKKRMTKNFSSSITVANGNLYVNSKRAGANKFWLYPKKNSFVKINAKPYRGKFLVTAGAGGLTVINTVALEDYLKAVVPSEMEPNAGIEALKAQAVVARTYAIATRGKHKSAGYDLCNTTCCQVYKGVSEENAKTNRAVESTRALVILHSDKPINAYYCASCGGRTESVEEAWPGAKAVKYAKTVDCPYCAKDDKMSWKYKINQGEFVAKMRDAGFNIDGVSSAKLYDKTGSGRYNTVEMRGGFGTLYYSAEIFRRIFGNTNIRSSFFNITIDKPKIATKDFKFNRIDDIIKARNDFNNDNLNNSYITFAGSGYGHGVGMCQHGAKKMAGTGSNFRRIINYYFTKEVNVKKIY
ncbi:MAG: hypothetical protein A2008_06960 [Candidatus Wallbacteria bacterium GWC2_49_35]|uniref:Sporulation stage II protein D amidase enhancer LytB N-terminal domain-containing protein n=1 Tax=Candidatus Wallbacteria bacterium GWC2_49_35 TaxID=1817813 RepID=A0A1F7WPJ9_9BACT|nr:MAG: hypothetical protein A2008_06960 [Candidatus Wallbacteria bacterium GWC2_49_35]HBC73807.1 hypothetical protein [Candidatus Wallbacteria bacterium]